MTATVHRPKNSKVTALLARLDREAHASGDASAFGFHLVLLEVWNGRGVPAAFWQPHDHPECWAAAKEDRERLRDALQMRSDAVWYAEQAVAA